MLLQILKKANFKKILLAALIVRLLLIPLSFHSDLNTYSIWGRYASEFGLRGFYDWLNFGNYARPDYPPLSMVLFLIIYKIWHFLFGIVWRLNITFSLFPSNFVPWFEKEGILVLLKLPGVIADLGIGCLIYNYFKKRSLTKAKFAASLFLFNPAVVYLSSSWGQLDSVVGFLGLWGLILLVKEKYGVSFTSFFTSVMLKVTMAPSGIIFLLQALKQKISLLKITILSLMGLLYLYVTGWIFIDKNPVPWVFNLYFGKLVKGAVTLPFINLNAFNFWGGIVGLERIEETTLFLGIPYYLWAWGLVFLLLLAVIWKFIKGSNLFYSATMIFYTIFMFGSRIHERYLYPVFLFLPFVVIKYPRLRKPFYILSLIFFINLYHWWWFPRIGFLVSFFSLGMVERLLSFLNLCIFGLMLKEYFAYTKK